MKTENVSMVQVQGIEVRCGNCGMGLFFSAPVASAVKTECVGCGANLATGILAAKQYFEFEKSATAFRTAQALSGAVSLRISTEEIAK
jgi:ribosomal protein S27E